MQQNVQQKRKTQQTQKAKITSHKTQCKRQNTTQNKTR